MSSNKQVASTPEQVAQRVPAVQRQERGQRKGSPTRPRTQRLTILERDDALVYRYPNHLREAIEDLPVTPGVYTFHGEEGQLPLYIGKSINLRSRVLAHLRTPEEARLLRQTKRISFERTAGEVGALLLESQRIKSEHPLHNQKLRRSRVLVAWRLADGKPLLVDAKQVDFAQEPGLYGLYANRQTALQHLHRLADEHQLCLSVLGLETLTKGRPCFRAQIKQCAGACCGQETLQAHQDRFQVALQAVHVVTWPYPGAVALIERETLVQKLTSESGNGMTNSQDCIENSSRLVDYHVIRNWCYLGTVSTEGQAKALNTVSASFDADSYKILCRPLLSGTLDILIL